MATTKQPAIAEVEEEWQVMTPKRRRERVSISPMHKRIREAVEIQKPRRRTIYIKNVPKEYQKQKELFRIVKGTGFEFDELQVLKTGDVRMTHFLRNEEEAVNKLFDKLAGLMGSKLSMQRPYGYVNGERKEKQPSFSCVITNVDKDITEEEIKEAMNEQAYSIKTLRRIRSRATGSMTPLIRIISNCKETVDRLLKEGFRLFGVRHRVEPSKLEAPQPKLCNFCTKFGHSAQECPEKKPKCGKCAGTHKTSTCTEGALKCPNCNKEHPAWSRKCEARPTQVAEKEAEPLKCIDESEAVAEESEDEPAPLQVSDFVRFTTTSLLNLFPDKRQEILKVISQLSRQFLNRKVAVNPSHNNIHISVNRVY